MRADGTFAVDVLPASLLAAAGMSLAFIPSLGTAISSARPEEGGLAAGIALVGALLAAVLLRVPKQAPAAVSEPQTDGREPLAA